MSMFDNIVFDEFTLLEGQQAEDYKKRKADEKKEKERREDSYEKRRGIQGGLTGDKNTDQNPNMKYSWTDEGKKRDREDKKRRDEAREKVFDHSKKDFEKDYNKRNKTNPYTNISHSLDAYNRHMRRHPKNESGIFSDVEMI